VAAGRGGRRGRGRDHEDEHPDERWLITYADMITLLMALFMVLFSISSVNTAKMESLQRSLQDAFSGKILPGGKAVAETGGETQTPSLAASPPNPTLKPVLLEGTAGTQEDGRREQEDLERLKSRVDAYAASQGISRKVETAIDSRGLTIRVLTDRLLFDSGSAVLKPASAPLMAKLAGMLRTESTPPHAIRVEGHTDSRPISGGTYPSNWELSTARAAAVVRSLEGNRIAPGRMEATGRSYLDPAGSNATTFGRARNRRVEIVLPRRQTPTPTTPQAP
jgi:chemotaxis protein MotB